MGLHENWMAVDVEAKGNGLVKLADIHSIKQ